MKASKLIAIFLAVFVLTVHAATTKPAAGKKPAASQGKKTAAQIDNYVSGEVSVFGIGARYERMLTPSFSVGGEAYWNTLIWYNDWGIIASGRFYPVEIFFVELGLGYNYHTGDADWEYDEFSFFGGSRKVKGSLWTSTSGFAISPGVGVRIDPGSPGGFFVSPGIKLPITIGTQEPVVNSLFGIKNDQSRFGATVGFVIYCGFGGAF